MRFRRRIVWVVLLLVAGTLYAKPSPQDTLYEQIRKNISLFGDVYREITLKYVDTVDPAKFIRAGIDGMLSTLDPYTVFISEDETDDLDMITSGKYGGVGIEIGIRGRDKVLTVISAMDDSPAQRVGIRNGDRIISIDGHSTVGFTTANAAKYLRGEPGTTVNLVIERTGSEEPIEFVVTRKEIQLKDVPYYGFVKPGVGYIKLAHFSRRAPEELDVALDSLKSDGLHAIILDLRGNPGGLLSSAVAISQRFCEKGQMVVSVRGRHSENEQVFKVSSEPAAKDIPLVVLIDGGSASASEIVAGAIQDLDRGVIIGEPTFGKGLVQSVIAFETGEALKLTTAKYYTPSGRLIQKVDYFHDDDGVVRDAGAKPVGYVTKNGRPVEGGGGISPDIAVATPRPRALGTELWRQGAFFDFVSAYRAKHPAVTSEELSALDLHEFRAWLDSTHFRYDVDGQSELDTLRSRLSAAGVLDSAREDLDHLQQLLKVRRQHDFEQETEFIRASLESELASSLFGARGRIEASFDDDPMIKKALEVLENKAEYQKVLAIGKPDGNN